MAVQPFHSYNLAGVWSVSTEDQKIFNMRLPGTLDENNIGHKDTPVPFQNPAVTEEQPTTVLIDDILLQETTFVTEELLQEDQPILSRFQRNLTYTGEARAYKMVSFTEKPGKRLFLEMERGRECRLWIDSEEVLPCTVPSLISPQVFEVTGLLHGDHMITVVMNNACREFPPSVLASNMCSDDTQTNWNGTLGYFRLREEEETFVDRIFTQTEDDSFSVFVEINALAEGEHYLKLSSDAFVQEYEQTITVHEGANGFKFGGISLKAGAERWDEECGKLHAVSVLLNGVEKDETFGIVRKQVSEEGQLLLNGKAHFLRMETNRALFPEFFYPPMDEDSWEDILKLYHSYGINSVYFDRWCPPEAAFDAADRCGMLLFPSVSVDDTEEDHDYYETEKLQIRRCFGGHPSCCFGLFPSLNISLVEGETMLPDFSEIDLFSAHLRPENLIVMRERVQEQRLLVKWSQAVETSGAQALRCYKRKISQAYLQNTAGIRLDSLQDTVSGPTKFSGMINSHLRQKPYQFARPKSFGTFFGPLVPLVVLKERSFEIGEPVEAEIVIVNHSGQEVRDRVIYKVLNEHEVVQEGVIEDVTVPDHEVVSAGMITIRTEDGIIDDQIPQKLTVRVSYLRHVNEEHVYLYPSTIPVCPETVYECEAMDDIAKEFLSLGGNVFLTPQVDEAALPLPRLLSDTVNPLIYHFPAENGDLEAFEGFLSGKMIPLRKNERPILMQFDAADYEAPKGCLFEYRCKNGNVLISTLNLKQKINRPEVRELVAAIYDYMGSYEFSPRDDIRMEDLNVLLGSIREA